MGWGNPQQKGYTARLLRDGRQVGKRAELRWLL